MVHTLQIAFLCFAFLFIFFSCINALSVSLLRFYMTLLYFGRFSSFLSVYYEYATIPIQWRFARIVSVYACLFFFLFFSFLLYIFYFVFIACFFFCFWFLHHLLFFFQFFFLFLVRCVWVNELLCFDAFHSRCLAKPWCKGKQKRPNCKSNLSFYTYIYRHQSILWFGIYEWTREYGERKSRINIDFVCVSFAFCHSAFSSSSVFCFVYFVCLSCALAHIWSPYKYFPFHYAITICGAVIMFLTGNRQTTSQTYRQIDRER